MAESFGIPYRYVALSPAASLGTTKDPLLMKLAGWLMARLTNAGIRRALNQGRADPNNAPMYAQRSRCVKTDRRDAEALAEACRLGAYRPAHRTSDRQRHVRALLGVRESLVRTRVRWIVLIRSLLRREGYRVASALA